MADGDSNRGGGGGAEGSAAIAGLAQAFDLPGDFLEARAFGSGHINETYAATFLEQDRLLRFVFQRLNLHVFSDLDALMSNIARVLAHLQSKLAASGLAEPERRLPRLLPTRSGALYHQTAEGDCWRVYSMVEGTRSFDIADSPARAFAAARAFATFLRDLSDLPAPRLHETIPRFHHTPSYLASLEGIVARDPHNRAAGARREIEILLGDPKRRALARSLVDLHAAGAIPERVIHNDTKLNNVLFDVVTDEALGVVDLDTAMPGLALYDFGDMVRTATSPRPEDERELAQIEARPEIFEALLRGYLEPLRGVLNRVEVESLVPSGQVITLECCSRFLADHLAGDVYFKVHRPEQNLDRCRAQLALLRSLEEREDLFRVLAKGVLREEPKSPAPPPPAPSRPTVETRGDVPEPEAPEETETQK
jgi:Ser/Thr protein kinase RdoA (MazF antagonist)